MNRFSEALNLAVYLLVKCLTPVALKLCDDPVRNAKPHQGVCKVRQVWMCEYWDVNPLNADCIYICTRVPVSQRGLHIYMQRVECLLNRLFIFIA